MNTLVSGGFGYIGSYIVDFFLRSGYRVGIIARNNPGYFDAQINSTEIYLSDICETLNIQLHSTYDYFIHLASANDIDSLNPYTAINATTLGTKNCLDFCVNNGIKNFIYFSTFQVYGNDKGFFDEHTQLACRNDYAISHMFGEEYVKMYHRNYGLNYIILRPSNIYGMPLFTGIDRWSLVPNCFCKEVFEKQTITLMSSGKQLRDFISLEDIANIVSIFCKKFEVIQNSVYNLASGRSIKIIDIAIMVSNVYKRLFNMDCKIKVDSDIPTSTHNLIINTEKINRLNYKFFDVKNMEREIEKIFKLLEGI